MSEPITEQQLRLPLEWWHGREWRRGERRYRPIRTDDLDHLMRWRNDQQDVLRQQQPLTPEHQRRWYDDVVAPSYEAAQPPAMLVVVEFDGRPIGYGGLTNIEWVSRRGELSFLAATERAADEDIYREDFAEFLGWVFATAFDELDFHRLFTETWAIRTVHIEVLERAGMVREGTMRQHVVKDGTIYDALLHGVLRTDPRIP
jgi:RimJ/RimL family protein N-acetyltransferase